MNDNGKLIAFVTTFPLVDSPYTYLYVAITVTVIVACRYLPLPPPHIYRYHEDGILTDLKKAFSRDQEQKIYAQHRIDEDPEMLYDYMINKGGSFYLCGPAGNMPAQMKEAVVNAFMKCGGHTEEEANKIVTDMQIGGRYNVEVW